MTSYFGFWQVLHFSRVFSVRKCKKRLDVSQLAYGVRNCSNMAWMPMRGMPTWWQKLGSFQGCTKIDHFWTKYVLGAMRLRLRACYFSTSLKLFQFFSRASYDQFKASRKVVWFSTSFKFPGVFSVKKMTINDRTCRNVHTVSKIIQTRYGCLAWACPLACKSWGQSWYFQKIPCSMESVRIGQKGMFGSTSFLDIP